MKKILFIDGTCNLCNGLVNILMSIDQSKKLYYASLQGQTAKEIDLELPEQIHKQTVIYYRNELEVYRRSDAVIEVLVDLFTIGKIFLIFKLIPKSIRDFIYKLIAKYRYKVFGQSSTCRIPSENEKNHFLN